MADNKDERRVRTVSMPEWLWDRVKDAADKEHRSVNAQIIAILEEKLGRPDEA